MRWIMLFSLFGWPLGQALCQWQEIGDFPGTARDDAASFSWGCNVYVGTGLEVGWTLTNDWWQYDVVAYTWSPIASLPASPRQYATAQVVQGTGLLFGGLDADGPMNELWAYDIATNTWNARAPLPAAARYACASFAVNGIFHVVGGVIEGGTALNELWAYDPDTDQWTEKTALPGVPRHRAAGTGNSTHGFVLGGADEDYIALNEAWSYDPVLETWTALPPVPEARFGASASTLTDSEQILLFAGVTDNDLFWANGHVYTPWTEGWTAMDGGLPDGRRGGVIGVTMGCPGWFFNVYGLGLDSSFTRRKDMYMSGYGFSIHEQANVPTRVFPNPATTGIHVFSELQGEQVSTMIFDALGRTVAAPPVVQGSPISIAALPPGMYQLVLREGDRMGTAAFIKIP